MNKTLIYYITLEAESEAETGTQAAGNYKIKPGTNRHRDTVALNNLLLNNEARPFYSSIGHTLIQNNLAVTYVKLYFKVKYHFPFRGAFRVPRNLQTKRLTPCLLECEALRTHACSNKT